MGDLTYDQVKELLRKIGREIPTLSKTRFEHEKFQAFLRETEGKDRTWGSILHRMTTASDDQLASMSKSAKDAVHDIVGNALKRAEPSTRLILLDPEDLKTFINKTGFHDYFGFHFNIDKETGDKPKSDKDHDKEERKAIVDDAKSKSKSKEKTSSHTPSSSSKTMITYKSSKSVQQHMPSILLGAAAPEPPPTGKRPTDDEIGHLADKWSLDEGILSLPKHGMITKGAALSFMKLIRDRGKQIIENKGDFNLETYINTFTRFTLIFHNNSTSGKVNWDEIPTEVYYIDGSNNPAWITTNVQDFVITAINFMDPKPRLRQVMKYFGRQAMAWAQMANLHSAVANNNGMPQQYLGLGSDFLGYVRLGSTELAAVLAAKNVAVNKNREGPAPVNMHSSYITTPYLNTPPGGSK